MEDACIINKSALERGFSHCCVYSSDMIDLNELKGSAGMHLHDQSSNTL